MANQKKFNHGGGGRRGDTPKVKANVFTPELVLNMKKGDYHTFIDLAKAYTAQMVRSKITTHMIRNLYGKAIKQKSAASLWKLEVDLAYMAGRNESNREFKEFAMMLSRIIRATTDDNLADFKEFFKTLVAYHKFNEKFNGKN